MFIENLVCKHLDTEEFPKLYKIQCKHYGDKLFGGKQCETHSEKKKDTRTLESSATLPKAAETQMVSSVFKISLGSTCKNEGVDVKFIYIQAAIG